MGAKPVSYTKWDSDVTGREMPPPVLEGYEIVREIGRGSMGHVYECTSDEFGSVAIKVLNLFSEGSDMAVERFRREVSVGGRIGHSGIPTVFDSGRLDDGRFFMVMELLHGSDLEDWWEETGHSRAEALDLICGALEPLAAAHKEGVVHRDLKPENLFVEETGTVRLLDFGVARDADASQNVRTATGISVGTPVYMSPEQATKPTAVGSSSDVWSVGVMLYEALCGELPFDGESPHAVILHACTREATPLLERVPEVHPEVRALVNHCLMKDPADRPANAGVLHKSLAKLLRRADVRETLVGPAAAPSFRLSHSTAPTKLRQDSPSTAPPLATDTAAIRGSGESLEPAPSSRKFTIFAVLGLAAAAAMGVSMARMNSDEINAASSGEEEPTTFATPPEAETQDLPTDVEAETATVVEPTIVPIETEAEAEEEPAEDTSRRRRRRDEERAVANAEPEAEAEPETELIDPEAEPEPEAAPEPVEEPPAPEVAVVPPPPTPMETVAAPRMVTRPVRPTRMRPRMTRPRPSEMQDERPGFVTF